MYRAYSTQKPHHRQSYGNQGYYGAQQQPPYGNGGYRAPTGPPPGADPQLWQWFRAVDTDASGGITVTELQSALVNGVSCMLTRCSFQSIDLFAMSQEIVRVSPPYLLNVNHLSYSALCRKTLIWIRFVFFAHSSPSFCTFLACADSGSFFRRLKC